MSHADDPLSTNHLGSAAYEKTIDFLSNLSNHIRTITTKIEKSKPDLVFMTNYSQLGLTGRALKEVGFQGSTMTILLEDPQIEIANGSLEGLIFATYQDSAEDFVSRYRAKFKMAPDLGADTGYDVLYVYKDAIERTQSFEPKLLEQALLKTNLTGASGTITFDSKGGVVKTPILKRLKGPQRIALGESK